MVARWVVCAVVLAAGCRAERRGAALLEASSGGATAGHVIPWGSGEHLLLGRRKAPLSIKVGPRTGSSSLIMGTEEIASGDGIPVHMHLNEDEIIFIHAGEAIATVGDHEQPVDTGTTIYVPRGTWHGVRNAAKAPAAVEMLWVFSAPGMDDYFRAIGHPPGVEPPVRSDDEAAADEAKHGIRYRP